MEKGGVPRELPTPALEAAIAALYREACATAFAAGSKARLTEAVVRVARQARSDGLRAEQLVVTFRAIWTALPRDSSLPRGSRDDRIVTALITAFYRDLGLPPDEDAATLA